jgi:hypothetical protein
MIRLSNLRQFTNLSPHPLFASYQVKVNSCPESARVYCLRWAGADSQRLFFWMQHPDPEDDADLVERVNKVLAHGGHV